MGLTLNLCLSSLLNWKCNFYKEQVKPKNRSIRMLERYAWNPILINFLLDFLGYSCLEK